MPQFPPKGAPLPVPCLFLGLLCLRGCVFFARCSVCLLSPELQSGQWPLTRPQLGCLCTFGAVDLPSIKCRLRFLKWFIPAGTHLELPLLRQMTASTTSHIYRAIRSSLIYEPSGSPPRVRRGMTSSSRISACSRPRWPTSSWCPPRSSSTSSSSCTTTSLP